MREVLVHRDITQKLIEAQIYLIFLLQKKQFRAAVSSPTNALFFLDFRVTEYFQFF